MTVIIVKGLNGRKFENEDELKRYLQNFYDLISEEFYASGICDLLRCWAKVIETNDRYKWQEFFTRSAFMDLFIFNFTRR